VGRLGPAAPRQKAKTPHNCHQNREFTRVYRTSPPAQALLSQAPVRFADSITVDLADGTSRALFFVDPLADYLKDHFPGAPTLPGLVMLESAVRAAAALWDATDRAGAGRAATLAQVERLQIVRRVVPGETLVVDTAKESADASAEGGRTMNFSARGSVGGDMAMRARFSLKR
jgi:3-hydroxymyristoyl/3-hydroxydecanoyl-(acyl carrier protein) dehydratase